MKTLKKFNLDTSNISQDGETRNFTIQGDTDAVFTLEVLNEDGHYYNFRTKTFSSTKAGLNNIVITNNLYKNSIRFPAITDDDHYDIRLWARDINNTKHATYKEVRFEDDTIDINSSTGSNSNLLTKKIYQYTNVTLTLSLAPFNTTWGTITPTTDTISGIQNRISNNKYSFTIVGTVAGNKGIQVLKQPTINDIYAKETRQLGTAVEIENEDLFEYKRTISTTNGTGSGATDITLDDTCATLGLVVGDAVVLGDYTDKTLLITHLGTDTGGMTDYQIRVDSSITWANDATVTFYYKGYHRWNIHANSSIHGITTGMRASDSSAVAPFVTVSNYSRSSEITKEVETGETRVREIEDDRGIYLEELPKTEIIVKRVEYTAPALDTAGFTPTYTEGVISKQLGMITFEPAQYTAEANQTFTLSAHNQSQIASLTGGNFSFSNLKVELTELTTLVNGAVSNNTSVTVDDRSGFINNVTRISAIGIDPALSQNPLVTAGGGNDGGGAITIDSAQTLEDDQVITLTNTGSVVTITGEIEIERFPTADLTIYFDAERFLYMA